MPDVKDKEWYDAMRKKVSEVLETLVLLEASFVGYIQLLVEKQPIILSWTDEVVTVSVDPYKWQMPIGWFIEPDMVSKVITPPAPKASRSAETVGGRFEDAFDAVAQLHSQGPGPPPLTSAPVPAQTPVPVGESLVQGGIQVPPGVRSVDEIMRDQGLDDADD